MSAVITEAEVIDRGRALYKAAVASVHIADTNTAQIVADLRDALPTPVVGLWGDVRAPAERPPALVPGSTALLSAKPEEPPTGCGRPPGRSSVASGCWSWQSCTRRS